MPCFFTFAPCSMPFGAGRDDERCVAARAELAVDRGDHDVDVGDAAVGRPRLLAVDDPLVLGLVVLGGRADRRDVGAGVGLGGAERGDLGVVGGAEALRDPLRHLLGRALAEDRGDRERGAHDRHPDPGVAPEELLVDDRQLQAGLVEPELGQRPRSRRGRSSRPPGSPATGVSSRSSHSAAAGRTTSAAKPWTQSRMSFWSWVSSSEKVGAESRVGAAPTACSTSSSALVASCGVPQVWLLLITDIGLCNIERVRVTIRRMSNDSTRSQLHGHRVCFRLGGRGPADRPDPRDHRPLRPVGAGDRAPRRPTTRCCAPDLLGHGESAKPRGDYSLGAYASGVRDIDGRPRPRPRDDRRPLARRRDRDAVRLPVPGALRAPRARLERRPRPRGPSAAARLDPARLRVGAAAADARTRVLGAGEAVGAAARRARACRPGTDLAEVARGFASLGDAEARAAFIADDARGARPGGPAGLRARPPLPGRGAALAAGLGRARPDHPGRARPSRPRG